ncbi:hypothetical protein ACKKBG_A21920 [Auxenochlorella protothecoides x Auxenochlorella symbiontica]
MGRPDVLPYTLGVLLLLFVTARVADAACDPGIGFFALPTIRYKDDLYMVDAKESDYYCRLKGYNGGGIVMQSLKLTSEGPFKNFLMDSINPASFAICNSRATPGCMAIGSIQCLPNGVPACAMDKDHNIGTGNTGKYNVGNNNVGDHNYGSRNVGDGNVGNELTGDSLLCNFVRSNDQCYRNWLITKDTITLYAAVPPPPPSPPPPGEYCDPRNKFFALPTIKYQNATYLTNSSNVDTYCRLQGFAGVGAVREERIYQATPFPQFTIDVLDPGTREACTPTNDTPCHAIAVVECLHEGLPKCTPDSNGNIGNWNSGMNNVGHNNHGSGNNGNNNHGSHVTGSDNWGDHLVCNDIQTGSQKECTIESLVTSETLDLDD